MDILDRLNRSQTEAVTATEGYIRVIAGAGSGKTRALSHRFAFLVNEIGILPGNILCVTFTNKSANEMRQRIHNLTGDNDTGYINTFHGFCVSVLQEESYAVQYPKSFLVLDNSDIDSMLKIIYEERGLTLRNMTFSSARDMVEIRKLYKEPEYYQDMITMSIDQIYEKYMQATETSEIIFYGYLYQEKKCFGLDYNDLIKFTLYIFENNEEIKQKWQKRLEYIMIDEFQDIDDLQYRLMCVLCGYHKNLFIVGDPDQTIYTWRGANVKYLLDFHRNFPDVQTIMMMENYRSTPEILRAANSLISKNLLRMKKNLIPTLPSGGSVLCCHGENQEKEALWMAEQIKILKEKGVPYKDITILYRAHYLTRSIEQVFLKEEIPYTIYSGVQFFGRMEIKDALSYLRMIAYRDDLSFLRIANVPKRNLGERRMKFIQEYAGENSCSLYEALCRNLDQDIFKGTKAGEFVQLIESFAANYQDRPVSEILSAALDLSGYERMLRTEGNQERLDNLAELKQSVYEYETTCGEEAMMEHYLAHVALFSNSDAQPEHDKVKLMTVHTSKGLEFPYVFLCGMNEGIFPSRKTKTREGMEEERRLAFVAMTRAKKRLYLSEAKGRNLDGSPRYPSRFILDIDQNLLEYDRKPEEGLIKEAREYIELSSRCLLTDEAPSHYPIGQKILHKIFGPGTIVDVDTEKSAYAILFDGMETPRTISFRVKLEKM
ncbi:ATP-dependent DNA helicase pcrA [uncultured Blautia sp.]|uniref:ATP-dependent helicase n=1 Tax=Blautia acetigignens TaxID=2981783 RepID=UPI00082328A3|nr:UvrD-helicase domain-containing protein [Blautia acetigignens]MCU6774114.1 UvrD-helicase domain-containing protein [Blautia acetigignens]SCH30370.1 ATP-dependent DNA helicase pcrA [uncultured Blautia sp.]